MHEVVTIAMVVWALVAVLGVALALGILVAILSILAEAFKH